MSRFMHTVRFFVGMAMLAGGAALARPFVSVVLAARGNVATASWPAAAVPGNQPGLPPMMMGGGGHAIPDPRSVDPPSLPSMPLPTGDQLLAVRPPQPPAPLPASGLDLAPAAPGLDGTYRSTVEIPPPPLLDSHAPPPLSAGWAAHDVAKPVTPVAAVQPSAGAAEYVVRDGDDLTAIALKVYGHAGAATAIWAANRDRLADPQVLPIGLSLRLPPTWMLPAAHHAAQGGMSGLAIEPTFTPNWTGGAANGHAGRESPAPAAHAGADSYWLQGTAARPAHPSTTLTAGPGRRSVPDGAATPVAAAQRPATVRVGMGDSLESIAVRFYGDRVMASRIWQANLDRLRSPDLLVPGVELRLP